MTVEIHWWLIIYEDGDTYRELAATLERAIEIQRTIYSRTKPIWAVIRLAEGSE